jgi:hypothetical protein
VGYGPVSLQPIPYDDSGKLFLLLDNPIGGVDDVAVNNSAINGWSWYNGPDKTGKQVSFLALQRTLRVDEKLSVRLRGKLSKTTGELLTNPADIVVDLLTDVCGLSVTEYDFAPFRMECNLAGLKCRNVLSDGRATVRTVVDGLMQSIGAVWSGGCPTFALLYPATGATSRAPVTFGLHNMHGVSVSASYSNIKTVLRLPYAYDFALGEYTRALELEAPEMIAHPDYGRIETEMGAHWLYLPRDAHNVAERLLTRLARPIWDVSFATDIRYASLPPGAPIVLDHPLLPLVEPAACTVLDCVADLDGANLDITTEIPAGPVPRLTLASNATAYAPQTQDTIDILYANGAITLTLYDDAGQLLPGATVTFDGITVRTSDVAGKVTFAAGRGQHHIKIEAADYATVETEITV